MECPFDEEQDVPAQAPACARRLCCWSGIHRLWQHLGSGCPTPTEEEVKRIIYKSRHEAMAEVVLEGGDGDAVFFWKVKPGTRAWNAGMRPGDQLLQVNQVDPAILFYKPAEDILPPMEGPVVLFWQTVPPQPEGDKTRINSRAPYFDMEEEVDDFDVHQPYPVSKACALGQGEWLCGACDSTNFDQQEFCRVCGIRDSRLPRRPGKVPVFNLKMVESRQQSPPVLYPLSGISKKATQSAAMDGHKFFDPTGQPIDANKKPRVSV